MAQNPLKTFIIYARKDEEHKDDLMLHLSPLVRAKMIEIWHDREIIAGGEWNSLIKEKLSNSDLILILVTVHSLNSDYIQQDEIETALFRVQSGAAKIIPIIVSPCAWELVPIFRDMQGLPTDMLPVIKWKHKEEAWHDVTKGVIATVEAIRKEKEEIENERLLLIENERLEKERMLREKVEAEERLKQEAQLKEQKRLEKIESDKKEKERLEKLESDGKERERLEKIEADRKEKERLEKLESDRKEKVRIEKLESDRKERERLEKIEADRKEKERLEKLESDKKERERLEKIESDRKERERLEKLESDRKERERFEKLESDRKERKRLEQIEADRIAKAEREKKAPYSGGISPSSESTSPTLFGMNRTMVISGGVGLLLILVLSIYFGGKNGIDEERKKVIEDSLANAAMTQKAIQDSIVNVAKLKRLEDSIANPPKTPENKENVVVIPPVKAEQAKVGENKKETKTSKVTADKSPKLEDWENPSILDKGKHAFEKARSSKDNAYYAKSRQYLEEAKTAKTIDGEGAYMLSFMYNLGLGGAKDLNKAWENAAISDQKGWPQGKYQHAKLYLGKKTKNDSIIAKGKLSEAKILGSTDATKLLSQLK